MRFGISLVAATFFVFAGYTALSSSGPLTMPAFTDGMAAPKTIATETVHAHRLTSSLIGVR